MSEINLTPSYYGRFKHYKYDGATWEVIRNDTSSAYTDGEGAFGSKCCYKGADTYRWLMRGYVVFDLVSLAGKSIESATIKLYALNITNSNWWPTWSPKINLYDASDLPDDSIVVSDYSKMSETSCSSTTEYKTCIIVFN